MARYPTQEMARCLLGTLEVTPMNGLGEPMARHSWLTLFGMLGDFTHECMQQALETTDSLPELSDEFLGYAERSAGLLRYLKTHRGLADRLPLDEFEGMQRDYRKWFEANFEQVEDGPMGLTENDDE